MNNIIRGILLMTSKNKELYREKKGVGSQIRNIRVEYLESEGKKEIFTLKDLDLWDGGSRDNRLEHFKNMVDDIAPVQDHVYGFLWLRY